MSLFHKIKLYSELVLFQHTIFSVPFIFIAMITASGGWFGFYLLIMGGLAAVSARNFAMALNRFADREFDAKNPRTKNRPSSDGRLSQNAQMAFIVLNGLAFILCGYFINDLAFYLSFPILFILGFYSFVKRFSSMAHIVLGLSLGLAPIAGVVAVSESITLWSVLLSLGVLFWVAGFDLFYSLQDEKFDKESGLYSIPSVYGRDATLFISALFHLLTIIFWLLFCWASGGGFLLYLAVMISGVILFYEHRLVRSDFSNINKAFFTMNGYMGVMFLVMVILDKVV